MNRQKRRYYRMYVAFEMPPILVGNDPKPVSAAAVRQEVRAVLKEHFMETTKLRVEALPKVRTRKSRMCL